ncbi:MAG: glycosyltransferase family 2 protein [Oculatellaceae cyanobacterium Prado106]|nr:glycosyltransferase family 2 protein [Oculatellaceae cyanobacterium Prado106]
MKQVSVIIPVYGVEKYVADTVQSVLEQTYPNFELIIVDDGSPDRSIEVCRRFKDPRIKILHQDNNGPAAARNLGIRHAKGDYIALLDGDDLWHPEKLAQHVAHLENSPEVGVSFCRSAFIDEAGESLGIYQITKLEDITLLDLLCRTPIGNGSVPVMRREVFEQIQFFSPHCRTPYPLPGHLRQLLRQTAEKAQLLGTNAGASPALCSPAHAVLLCDRHVLPTATPGTTGGDLERWSDRHPANLPLPPDLSADPPGRTPPHAAYPGRRAAGASPAPQLLSSL